MIALLLAQALAAPVLCDPEDARTLLDEARIDERRAPITHHEMVPGLALASGRAEPALLEALGAACTAGDSVSIAPGDAWEDTQFSAYTYRVTSTRQEGCALHQQTVTVSVGLAEDELPTYRLLGSSPAMTTPIGACDAPSTWREETVIDGDDGPVRLVLVVDRSRREVFDSAIVVRRATPGGWHEQVLASPAPDRYLDGVGGPAIDLAETGDGPLWIVSHANRRVDDGVCTAVPGQTVWTWQSDTWLASEGRQAMHLLASAGLWRLAGGAGWLHIVVQDDEGSGEVLGYRTTRLQRRYDETLHTYLSADLPGLNSGFLVVAPAPFPTEADATAAKAGWRSMHRHYVKRAWVAPDPCAPLRE